MVCVLVWQLWYICPAYNKQLVHLRWHFFPLGNFSFVSPLLLNFSVLILYVSSHYITLSPEFHSLTKFPGSIRIHPSLCVNSWKAGPRGLADTPLPQAKYLNIQSANQSVGHMMMGHHTQCLRQKRRWGRQNNKNIQINFIITVWPCLQPNAQNT